MWLESYIEWVRTFVECTKLGYICLDISQCMSADAPLCRKHSMAVTQELLLIKSIDKFLVPPDYIYQILPKEVSHRLIELARECEDKYGVQFKLPIKIEDIFNIRQRIIFICVVPINSFIDYLSLLSNTYVFEKTCQTAYGKYYSCMWCHRSWVSQSVCMINKRKSAHKSGQSMSDRYHIDVKSINEFIRCQPSNLSVTDKIKIIEYGLSYFSSNDYLKEYKILISELWEKANHNVKMFHQLLNKRQIDWLDAALSTRSKKRPKHKNYKDNNYQNSYYNDCRY